MFRLLLRLLAHRPSWLVAALVTWIGFSLVPIVLGVLTRQLFDALQDGEPLRRLVLLFVGLGALTLFRPALATLWFWVHATFEPMVEALVRTNLVRWAIRKSGRNGRAMAPVAMVGHVRDDVPGFTDLVNEWYRIVGEGFFVVIALVIMLSIDPLITLVAFLPLFGVVLFTHWARARLPQLVGRAREATIAVTNFIGDVFGGVQSVKVFGAERRVVRRFQELNRVRARAEVKAQATQAWIESITQATVVAGSGLVLLVGATAMLNGRFTVGDFMLFTIYLDWMLQLPRRLGRLLSQQKTSRTSVARLQAALDRTPVATLVHDRPTYLTRPPPVVENPTLADGDRLSTLTVEGLTYHYPEEAPPGTPRQRRDGSGTGGHGIVDISFTVPGGSITVITGELGSGKSTLLEVLLGQRAADSGRIRWNGVVVDDPASFMVPPRVAYKPQLPRLFSESLADNVRLGWRADRGQFERALTRASLAEDVARMPGGGQTTVGPRGVRLSGGQVQRVSAARMLIRQCQLYLVDDLSSALDPDTEEEIWQAIEESRRQSGTAYLVVSHRRAALRRADQVLVMKDGSIVHRGTPAELVTTSEAVRRILEPHPE